MKLILALMTIKCKEREDALTRSKPDERLANDKAEHEGVELRPLTFQTTKEF